MSHNEAEFRRLYVEPYPERVAAVIDLDAHEKDNPNPVVEVRYKGHVAFVFVMPMVEHLDLDVHAFSDGEDTAIGVMGMTEGKRFAMEETGETVVGWHAARTIALFVGRE